MRLTLFWKRGQNTYTVREDLSYANCFWSPFSTFVFITILWEIGRCQTAKNGPLFGGKWNGMWRAAPPIPRWLLNYIPHPRLQRGRKIVKWRFQGAVYLWIREGPCLAQHRPHCHSRLGTGLANKMTEEMVICREGGGRIEELRLRSKCFCINILQLKCQWCVCSLSVDLRHNKCSVMQNTFGNIYKY